MPHLTIPVVEEGPLFDVVVGVSRAKEQALRDAGMAAPPAHIVRALIDTGASCSTIDPAIVRHLGLQPTGRTTIITPTTGRQGQEARVYDVSIRLVHVGRSYVLENSVPVVESSQSHNGFLVLLGRDILRDCLLIYDGPAKSVCIAF